MELVNAIFNWLGNITFLQIIDFIGTFAFAISGIRLASAKQFDWFGAYVVGAATAIGGGTLRDVMLDVPVFWMHDGIYLTCTGLALLWVILFRKLLIHMHNTFFVFDAVGLALFTIVGIQKTLDCGLPIWVAVVMGTMTGAAGGVIRDVLINEVPLIFRKEIYAMACVVGGLIYGVCDWLGCPNAVTLLACGAAIFTTRVLAVKHQICLPTLKDEESV
ncbi:MAG: trimeric intracellular cation channel family protein [Bacteroidaceae bacterium]|nr:trimeric intracellular cation channel family protein [Bacteroidaceae bacterium]